MSYEYVVATSWQHQWLEPLLMKKVLTAPNLALATLWADQLCSAGIGTSVQRAYASGIAGQIPVDQALPEVWVDDAEDRDRALALLDAWQRLPHLVWACKSCHEIVEGPFEQCWNCGAAMPALPTVSAR